MLRDLSAAPWWFIGWIPAPGGTLYRTASLLTGGAGNGLYTSGAALTLATIANAPAAVIVSSAALMALFIPWVVVTGMRLR